MENKSDQKEYIFNIFFEEAKPKVNTDITIISGMHLDPFRSIMYRQIYDYLIIVPNRKGECIQPST